MFKPRKKRQSQSEFWVVADRLPQASPSRFYELLNGTLERMRVSGAGVGELCGGVCGRDPGRAAGH